MNAAVLSGGSTDAQPAADSVAERAIAGVTPPDRHTTGLSERGATTASDAADPTSQAASAPAARSRLAPLVERPARPLTARTPIPGPPPVAGSREALARSKPADAAATTTGPGTRTATAPGTTGADQPVRPARRALPVVHPALPDPIPLCCAMVQAAVEALRGARPLAQLAKWVSPEIYDQLAVRSELTQRVLGQRDTSHRAAIRRIRLCRLGDDAAEATVIVEDGPRVRAVAVRLEGHRGQWRATAMEIG